MPQMFYRPSSQYGIETLSNGKEVPYAMKIRKNQETADDQGPDAAVRGSQGDPGSDLPDGEGSGAPAEAPDDAELGTPEVSVGGSDGGEEGDDLRPGQNYRPPEAEGNPAVGYQSTDVVNADDL